MKRVYYILFLSAILISCEKPISVFQTENFIKFFGSGYESKGNDVIELSDGGYLITGYDKVNAIDHQVFAAKIEKDGNLVWSNTYGNSNYWEEGKIVKEVSDGFIIAGISKSNSGTSIIHSFIMKTNVYGDSLWYKEFGDPTYSIIVNDITINGSSIYVAGLSNKSDASVTDFYRAKLDTSGVLIWGISNFLKTNSSFKRVFVHDDNLLLAGTYGVSKVISIVSVLQSNGNAISSENTTTVNESVGDACLASDQLFLLKNSQAGGSNLSKLSSGNSEVWLSETFNSITGKSIAYNDDGSLMICGESLDDGGFPIIKFIRVNADGTVYMGVNYYKSYLGTVEKVIQTKDKGLILIGATNATYGTNVQLIKTDKDYFMLKNN